MIPNNYVKKTDLIEYLLFKIDYLQLTNEKSINEKSTNEKSTNEKSTNEKSINEKSTNEKSTNENYYINFCIFNNLHITKCNNCDYKKLFIELLHKSKTDYIIKFMKKTLIFSELATNEEKNFKIDEYKNKKINKNKEKKVDTVIIDNYIEKKFLCNTENNCIIS